MKKFKRPEKHLYFLEIITEEDLADSSHYFKRRINDTEFTQSKPFAMIV